MAENEGQVVLLTGASGGLGSAVNQAFLDAGATVAAISHSDADLTDPTEAARAVVAAKDRYGRIDALVHLMGGFDGGTPVAATTDAVWKRMFDLNVHAAFYVTRAVLPAMLAAGSGRIVAVGSRTAVEPAATLSAYGASKAALVSLIRTIALEGKASGVAANVILPSVIDTAANRAAMPKADYSRWVRPESIARLLVWLALDAPTDLTGAVIPIYGRA